MSTPTFELDRSPAASIATLEVIAVLSPPSACALAILQLTGGIELNFLLADNASTYTERASQEDCCGSQPEVIRE